MIRNLNKIKLLRVTALILVLTRLCGCTQHNGYLGALFGSWALVEITHDGMSVDLGDETVFSFQNEIVRVIRYIDPPYKTMTRYGNFTHSGEELSLRFMSEPTESGSRMYMAPEWLYFPKDTNVLHFEVRKLTGSEMVLDLDSDGVLMQYRFKKTW